MKKTFTIFLLLAALTTMSFVITKDDPPRYKNLKVLPKDISKEQMDSIMHHFSAAMGQKCNFCHVFNQAEQKMDFVNDAKPEKETAREMWRMTIKLNKKSFDISDSKKLGTKLRVTCYTCHHGETLPETMAPARQGPPPGGQAAPKPPVSTDSTKRP
ncbi:MAG: c-type cytochrome [Ferruginibacter sp.]